MVMDLKALSRLLKAEVVNHVDRTRLDAGELLDGLPATTENLAVAIWKRLASVLAPAALDEVSIAESAGKRVRYRGE